MAWRDEFLLDEVVEPLILHARFSLSFQLGFRPALGIEAGRFTFDQAHAECSPLLSPRWHGVRRVRAQRCAYDHCSRGFLRRRSVSALVLALVSRHMALASPTTSRSASSAMLVLTNAACSRSPRSTARSTARPRSRWPRSAPPVRTCHVRRQHRPVSSPWGAMTDGASPSPASAAPRAARGHAPQPAAGTAPALPRSAPGPRAPRRLRFPPTALALPCSHHRPPGQARTSPPPSVLRLGHRDRSAHRLHPRPPPVLVLVHRLGAVGLADRARSARPAASAAAAYTNQPIVPPQSSGELSPAGDAFEYVQFASTVYLPQADGWCKNNVGCSDNITNGNSEQCYSIFYPVPKYGPPTPHEVVVRPAPG